MELVRRTQIAAYSVSLAAVAVAIGVRLLLDPLLGDRFPFPTAFAAVAFAAWYGGKGPAYAALIAGAGAVIYFIIPPRYSLAIDQIAHGAGLVLYTVVGFALITMFESLRKAWQEAARKSELLQAILDSLPAHIAVIDRQGIIIKVNRAWEQFAQDNGAAVVSHTNVGADYLAVCERAANQGDELAAKIHQKLCDLLEERLTELRLEYPCHSQHEQRWFMMTAAPISIFSRGAVISHYPITDLKQAEAAVIDREARMRAILSAATDAIISIDQRGIISDANSATEKMFGYATAALIGKNVSVLMPAPYCDEHDAYIAHYLQTGEASVIGVGRELVARRKDGSTFPVDLSISEVGHLGLFTGIIRDITQRKQLEADVLNILNAQDMRLGHELHDSVQQQLTGLALIAEDLAETLGATESCSGEAAGRQEWAKRAAQLAGGISKVLNELHQLARGLIPVEVDSGGLVSALSQLATDTSQLTRSPRQPGESQASPIICMFKASEPVEVADNNIAHHLYRIAQEAVNNAVKHGKCDRIEISLERTTNRLCLQVVDNGIGVGDRQTPGKIAASKGHRELGLRTMAYRAGLIGATFRIDRAPERGTRVRCILPI